MAQRWAKARKKPNGQQSKLEQQYQAHLQQRLDAGEIQWFAYERVKLRLADKTFYTPDFMVLELDGTVTLVEVKGSWSAPNQDKSRVKLKVAAETYWMFRFVAATKRRVKDGGGFEHEEFNA